ncbi:response regulator transcription factor [Kitasatospora sp. NPDC059327]|uniref:response regulator transcription factor n=1 Tax=Kitasatospora sp. NPDC059327 TaxID=3346803 RepID=UPI0036842390
MAPPPPAGLTPALVRIGALRAGGTRVREIARRTGRSPDTVTSHLRNLHRRLGVSNGAHAVYRLHQLGLLPAGYPCPCSGAVAAGARVGGVRSSWPWPASGPERGPGVRR